MPSLFEQLRVLSQRFIEFILQQLWLNHVTANQTIAAVKDKNVIIIIIA